MNIVVNAEQYVQCCSKTCCTTDITSKHVCPQNGEQPRGNPVADHSNYSTGVCFCQVFGPSGFNSNSLLMVMPPALYSGM
jgi:hypothetical protein